MSKNNEQLVELIKDVVSGNKEKDVFCKEFYKEVYAIVYPVFGENSKKVTSRAFIYLCDNLDKIDVSRNVHRQIATLVSTFMFGLIDKKTIKYDAELSDYEFNRIKDDVELYNIIRDNVKMFKNPVDFERASDSIKELTRVQTIVLELYGYEMHSVEEIEELLDMDSAFIYGIIGQIKAQILGINISVSEDTDDAMEESGVDVYEEQEENDEYVPEDDNESEEEQPADSSNDEDEDEADAEVIYGGSFEKPELKALVKKEVSLALLPGELLPRDAEDAEKNDDAKTDSTKKDSAKTEDKKTKEQSTGDSDELTVEEQTERLEEITEKFALLGIPVIIDRSANEKTELAQYEWIKVYGVLFGCEEKMDKMFEKAVDEAGVQENQ